MYVWVCTEWRHLLSNARRSRRDCPQLAYVRATSLAHLVAGSSAKLLQHVQSLLLVFGLGHPECITILGNLRKHSTTCFFFFF